MAFLLTWADSIGLSIATDYVKQAIQTGINHLLYMFCLKQFVEELDKEERALGVIQQEVHRIVDEEGMNTNVPDEPVEDWILRTDQEMKKAQDLQNKIKEDRKCINGWCVDWLWRYQKSTEADNLTATLKTLKQERSQFTKLVHEAVLPNIAFLRTEGFMPSQASKSALSDIMDALTADGVHMIGLHGMPGSGKTTLAKKVKDEAARSKLFDEFVIVTIAEKPDITAIRDQIAEQLHLKFDNDSSVTVKANKLMLRLQDKKKKLIVLDDVWGELNLNEIGIPSGNDLNNCKVLLTTRRIPVCEIMNCESKILLDLLIPDEAWNLMKISACLKDDSSVAKMVAKECGGLPIAIVSVGKALRGKSIHGWERALKKLQEGEYLEIRDMNRETNAYRSLKFSYDELPREETKRCLLLCSLYPEDQEIRVEDLARYAFGLGLYQKAGSIKDTIIEVVDAIEELIDSHLLLEGEKEGRIKMHDLVRDVVLSIGKNNKALVEFRMETVGGGVIGFEEPEPGKRLKPLEIMLIFAESFVDLRHETFEGMEKLKVVSVNKGLVSLRSLQHLTNLQTLELRKCGVTSEENATNNLALLPNLETLQILSLADSLMRELPYEMRELENLKLLELSLNYNIDRIPPNVIGNLSNLEELHLGSFQNWDVEGNASLMEVNSLQSLDILSLIYRKDIPDNFYFSSKLSGYCLHLSCNCLYVLFKQRLRFPALRKICFRPTKSNVEACKGLFRNVYDLYLVENDACFRNMIPDISEVGFQDLSRLQLYTCEMECLVSSEVQRPMAPNAFSNLLELEIKRATLREICEGLPPEYGFLEKLQTLRISECNQITTVFPAKLSQGMQSLKTVKIDFCEKLQEVFHFPQKQLSDANKEYLSHLTTLELVCLYGLVNIWKGPTRQVNLKSLTHLTLSSCWSLTSVLSPSVAKSLMLLEELTIEHCDQIEHIIAVKDEWEEVSSEPHLEQGYLQNLKKVIIVSCDRLEYVFPVSIARRLSRLEIIYVSGGSELKQVFCNENGYEKLSAEVPTKAPSEVGYFFSSGYAEGLPSLRHVGIVWCPQLLLHSFIRLYLKVSTDSEIRVPYVARIPLETLEFKDCSELQHIITEEYDDNKDTVMLKMTRLQQICFTNLKKIVIVSCNRLKILLPIKVAQGLPHLALLHINSCSQLEAIFKSEDEADITGNIKKMVPIPTLFMLSLEELPSLRTFCPKGYHFIFSSLKLLKVKSCPQLITSFIASSDSFVHAKLQAPALLEEPDTQILVAPWFEDNGCSGWFCPRGKWITEEEAGEDDEKELNKEIENFLCVS